MVPDATPATTTTTTAPLALALATRRRRLPRRCPRVLGGFRCRRARNAARLFCAGAVVLALAAPRAHALG